MATSPSQRIRLFLWRLPWIVSPKSAAEWSYGPFVAILVNTCSGVVELAQRHAVNVNIAGSNPAPGASSSRRRWLQST